jgi:hypothetical protein
MSQQHHVGTADAGDMMRVRVSVNLHGNLHQAISVAVVGPHETTFHFMLDPNETADLSTRLRMACEGDYEPGHPLKIDFLALQGDISALESSVKLSLSDELQCSLRMHTVQGLRLCKLLDEASYFASQHYYD